jgi:hypothetical protein
VLVSPFDVLCAAVRLRFVGIERVVYQVLVYVAMIL